MVPRENLAIAVCKDIVLKIGEMIYNNNNSNFVWFTGEKRDCYSSVLEEYNTYVCTCNEDGCNGSATMKVSIISIIMAFVMAAVFK